MARARRRTSVLAATALAASLALAGCSGGDEATFELSGVVVDPPFEPAPTELVDTEGEPYSLTADTDKRLTLAFFGYTNCPDICQTVMLALASAMTRLDEADREEVEVVFITTDPANDTGPVLRDYLDRIDPSFVGVTGDLDDIVAVGESVAVGMGDELPSGGFDVTTHSTQVTGIDSADEAPLFWRATTSSAQFAADIQALLEDA